MSSDLSEGQSMEQAIAVKGNELDVLLMTLVPIGLTLGRPVAL